MSEHGDGVRIDRPDPRLSWVLRVAIVVALVAAVPGAVVSGPVGTWAGGVSIGLIVGVPLLRVGYFAIRWARMGDRRYAATAFALLAVIAIGAAAASVL